MAEIVDFTVVFGGVPVDLGVSSRASLSELREILARAFVENGVSMPESWHLTLAGKYFNLGRLDGLDRFPVSTGDVLEIVEGE